MRLGATGRWGRLTARMLARDQAFVLITVDPTAVVVEALLTLGLKTWRPVPDTAAPLRGRSVTFASRQKN